MAIHSPSETDLPDHTESTILNIILCLKEWGDKRTVEDLFTYLEAVDRKRADYSYFWAAMAELTPTTFDVIFRPGDGLRKLSDQAARNVTLWYRDLWWKTTSIAAVDFFHSTDIVDIAIGASIKRVHCSNVPPNNPPTTMTRSKRASSKQEFQSHLIYRGPHSIRLIHRNSAYNDSSATI